jgi:DNA-binding CsgD family transcriptional regulator
MYGLTAAEAKIAAILGQGNSLNEACRTLSIKQNTARTHLKRIFSKTDTNRQSELVKLILNSPANLRVDNLSKA